MSIYMSRAELEEISEGLITAYANKFSNRVIQSIDIEHFITEFLMLRIEYAFLQKMMQAGLVFWQMEQHHCWYIRTEKLFPLFSRKIPSYLINFFLPKRSRDVAGLQWHTKRHIIS